MAQFTKNSLSYVGTEYHHIFKEIAKHYLEADEVVHVAAKSSFREYLLVTDKGIHIGKGKSFSDKRLHPIYQVRYSELSSVQSQSVFLGICCLILKGTEPPLHQNSVFPVNGLLSLNGSAVFDAAAHEINTLWKKWKSENPVSVHEKRTREEGEETADSTEDVPDVTEEARDSNGDKFAEIRKYKELLDDGIIAEEEFDEMKKKLLA